MSTTVCNGEQREDQQKQVHCLRLETSLAMPAGPTQSPTSAFEILKPDAYKTGSTPTHINQRQNSFAYDCVLWILSRLVIQKEYDIM